MAWNDTERLRARFRFVCDARWDEMSPTEDPGMRHCARCSTAVFAADTEAEFNHHASQGRCVFASTSGGGALVAKPEGPPGPPPPLPRPLGGAPMPINRPPPPPLPEPQVPREPPVPVKQQHDYGVGGVPVMSTDEVLRRHAEHEAWRAEKPPPVAPEPPRPSVAKPAVVVAAVVAAILAAIWLL